VPPPLNRAAEFGISYRPLREDDFAFTAGLYASTRTEELMQTGWPEEAKQAFLAQQHRAQHEYYQGHYQGAEWLIVEQDGAAIGRLYLHEADTDIRVIDIALLPGHRGAGIGAALIDDLLASAGARGKSVSLHVEPNNPVRRLYLRLGFVAGAVLGAYQRMDWAPGT
jgi:ribosomal protein S18 acetylase RimI-like enzyme